MTVLSGPILQVGEGWCTVPVHKRGSTLHALASLCANIRQLPIPDDSVIHAQRPDDLLPFVLVGRDHSWVCTIHGNPHLGMKESRSNAIFAGYTTVETFVLRQASGVIFVDSQTAGEYAARLPWLKERIAIIPNAIDIEMFRPVDRGQERRKWGFDGTTFLYAGRIEEEKRVVEIVRAFRALSLKDTELVIAGDGREKRIVEAEAYGANVKFLGTVSRSSMPSLLNAADAVVLFSTREGLPSTVLEALACGTPVIATPVGALPEVVKDGKTGVLISSREELTEAMRSVCRGEVVPSPSIAHVVEPYSWPRLGARILEVYMAAVSDAPRACRPS